MKKIENRLIFARIIIMQTDVLSLGPNDAHSIHTTKMPMLSRLTKCN